MFFVLFKILHSLISSVDKLPITQQGCPLRVRTKNFLSAEFLIPKEGDCTELHGKLNKLRPGSLIVYFCFDRSQQFLLFFF